MSEMVPWVKAFAVPPGQPEFRALPPTNVKVDLTSEHHAHTIAYVPCAHTSCAHTIIHF